MRIVKTFLYYKFSEIGNESVVDNQRNDEGLKKKGNQLNDFCGSFDKNNTAKLKFILFI